MKLATWNINSVRLRIDLVTRFLDEERPDVLCLQEIKCRDDQFPAKAIAAAGYAHHAVLGQKGYHGVAIVSRTPLSDVETLRWCDKDDARHISAVLQNGVRVHNFYVPAGGDEPDPEANEKFAHKLSFMREMAEWSAAATARRRCVLVGDLNIAPCEHDVWSHKQLLNVVSHTPIEVDLMRRALGVGKWIDVARAVIPEPEKVYTWWSYRAQDWRASNRGRRLDHVWVSPALKSAALAKGRDGFRVHDRCRSWEKPSDHVPVTLELVL